MVGYYAPLTDGQELMNTMWPAFVAVVGVLVILAVLREFLG